MGHHEVIVIQAIFSIHLLPCGRDVDDRIMVGGIRHHPIGSRQPVIPLEHIGHSVVHGPAFVAGIVCTHHQLDDLLSYCLANILYHVRPEIGVNGAYHRDVVPAAYGFGAKAHGECAVDMDQVELLDLLLELEINYGETLRIIVSFTHYRFAADYFIGETGIVFGGCSYSVRSEDRHVALVGQP